MTTIIGNYELVTQLATGGMAETHVARSLTDGSVAVVKLLLPRYAGNPEFVEMFVDEGRVISSLKHPNVVAMRAFGFHNELPYLAMEYLHGVDLRTLCRTLVLKKKQQMPIDVALYIASAMCGGLNHAHDARTIDGKPMEVTHRDVSPQNVVLTFTGEVKLIDFGIATARGRAHETRSGALKGKIPYMAPEQVRAAATDRRTDVYATGVVLYEMLTARRPYIGKRPRPGEFSLMMAIVNNDVVPIDTVRVLPKQLAGVVMKALALEPSRRYQTSLEMQTAIGKVADEIGAVLSAEKLSTLMHGVIAPRNVRLETTTAKQVFEIVSEVEGARTKVDERHDPSVVDHSELNPHTSKVITDKVAEASSLATTSERPDLGSDTHSEPDRAPIVDKIVEPNVTRLRFHRPIEAGFRWGRLFDGIEGSVEVDFTKLAEMSQPSIAAATDTILRLGDEVSEIRLIAVPIILAVELEERCQVVSVSCRGWCPSCETRSGAILGYDELRTRLAAGSVLPCSHCSTGLVDIELASVSPPVSASMRSVGSSPNISSPNIAGSSPNIAGSSIRMLVAGVAPPGEAGVAVDVAVPAPVAAPPVRPAGERAMPVLPSRMRWGVFLGLVIGIGIIVGGAWFVTTELRRRAAASLPPLAHDSDVSKVGDEWSVALVGEGTSDGEALGLVRRRALAMAIDEIESDLPERIRPWIARPPLASLDVHPDGRIDLDESEVRWDRTALPRVSVRFRIAPSTRARLRTFYSATRTIAGLEVANAPPSQPRGILVVAAPEGAILVGDRIVSIDGRAVVDLAPLAGSAAGQEIIVERPERRTITITGKP